MQILSHVHDILIRLGGAQESLTRVLSESDAESQRTTLWEITALILLKLLKIFASHN